MMRLFRYIGPSLAIAASLATQVQAQFNGSCNGSRTEISYFENRTNIGYAGGAHLATEQTTFTVTGNFTSLSIAVTGDQSGMLCSSVAACNGYVFTAPADGTYRFEMTGRGGAAIGPPLTPGGPALAGTVVAECVAATTEEDEDADEKAGGSGAAGRAAAAAGGASTGAINAALNAATSGLGGATVTRNALTFSTAGSGALSDSDWNLWGAAAYRGFDGGVDGSGYELTFGADTRLGAARLGVLVSYGDYDLTVAGSAVTTSALSFGPYARVDLSSKLSLTGFVTYAQPDYTVAGTSFSADRFAGALRLSSTYRLGGIELESFVMAEGFSEDHPVVGATPARTLSQLSGSIGSKATFTPDAATRPYVSLAGVFSRFDDGLGTSTEHLSPRLGAGVVFDGGPGVFELHIDGGEILNGTRDYGLSLGYSLNF